MICLRNLLVIGLIFFFQGRSGGQDPGLMDSLLRIAESGNTVQAAQAYKDLALYTPQDSLARHLYFAKKGVKIAREIGDLKTAGNLYMNMGVAYVRIGN